MGWICLCGWGAGCLSARAAYLLLLMGEGAGFLGFLGFGVWLVRGW